MAIASHSKRAARFRAARKQDLLGTAQDYTELIADLIQQSGEARTGEIARHLGISHVTALRTLRRLAVEGFVITSRHSPIMLTTKGRRTAALSKARHQLLLDFLVALGVPKAAAERDVEGLEHHISPATLRAIKRYLGRC